MHFKEDKQSEQFENVKEALSNTITKISLDIGNVEQLLADKEIKILDKISSTTDSLRTRDEEIRDAIISTTNENTSALSKNIFQEIDKIMKDKGIKKQLFKKISIEKD